MGGSGSACKGGVSTQYPYQCDQSDYKGGRSVSGDSLQLFFKLRAHVRFGKKLSILRTTSTLFRGNLSPFLF